MQRLPGSDEPGARRGGGLPGAAASGHLRVQQCDSSLREALPGAAASGHLRVQQCTSTWRRLARCGCLWAPACAAMLQHLTEACQVRLPLSSIMSSNVR